jgi:iron complex outermembrane recepter protein
MRHPSLLLAAFTLLLPTGTARAQDETQTSTMSVTTTATITEVPPEPTETIATPVEEPPPVETPPAEEPPAEVEEIVVTGSRIRMNPLDEPSPITQLSRADLEGTGLTAVADMLQRLPVSGGALNTKFNSSGNFGFPPDGDGIGAGAAQADLRYLGSKRVLVLVDGVRWVNGSSASGVSAATDLNTIPVNMIERIEVLQDGASALYGSDAIGGVINIITKKKTNGIEAGIYFGGYHEGDGLTQQYDITWGASTERLSIVLGLSYVRQDEVWSGDREISSYPIPNFTECTGTCSSATPQGRFVLNDPNTMMDVDITPNAGVGGVPMYDPANPTGGDYHAFATADRFNFSPYNYMLTPSRRFGTFANATYKITDSVNFNSKILYANRTSKNQAAPEPLFIGPEAGNGNRLDRISIDATNPYNPFGFTIDANTNPFFIGRRPVEAGPRLFRQFVNTYYISGGLSGALDVAERNLFWDVTTAYARNRADQIKTGGFNSEKLQKALGPLDECQADPNCVPFNLFGGQGADGRGTITPEMLNYVGYVQKDVSEQEFFDAQANATTELIELPAGGLGIAAGVEYRRLAGFFRPDAVVTAGDTSDIPAQPTDGKYGVTEGYAEIRIPILAKMPGADLLDLSGAVRISDYSTFGSAETFKLGARYRPFEDLLFRGTWGQGFRAPGIGELFGTEARFDQTLNDPCSDFNGVTSGAPAPQSVKDNCIALGVPADGSYEQFNAQISVATGGNRELEPETSNGYTVSLVYSPSFLEGDFAEAIDFEVSYYRVDLDAAIRALDAQVQLERCVRNLDPVLCAGISRTPNGTINRFANKLTNIGGLKTDGLDFNLGYTSPATSTGRWRANFVASYLLNWTESIPTAEGFEEVKRAGTEIGDPVQGFPRFKSTLSLGWAAGEFGANITGRYVHSLEEDCTGLAEFPGTCSAPNMMDDDMSKNKLDAVVYVDFQATWRPNFAEDKLSIALGVNNVLNQEPPACYSCALNGMDAGLYDVPGIFGYVRAGYRLGD